MRPFKALSAAVLVLITTRVLGVLRDILISVTYGLSKVTDLFFQTTFFPTYVLNIYNGPFTTAFMASFNHAPAQDRPFHLLAYRRRSLFVGAALSVLFLGGSWVASEVFFRADQGNLFRLCLVLTPSCLAMAVLGFAAAAANACGLVARALAILTVSNAVFVLGVFVLWLSPGGRAPWGLQLAFTVSSVAAAIVGWVSVGRTAADLSRQAGPSEARYVVPLRLPGLRRGMALALAESAAFIATQLIVLTLASHAGVGWAAAVSLAQRLSLSAISLAIVPITNTATVAAIRSTGKAYRIFGWLVSGVFLASALGAACLAIGGPWLMSLASAHTKMDPHSVTLVVRLLPAFSVWFIAMALNATISRLMFGFRLGQLYALTMVGAYVAANAARIWLVALHQFPAAIAMGAAIEMTALLALAVYVFVVLRAGSYPRETELRPKFT